MSLLQCPIYMSLTRPRLLETPDNPDNPRTDTRQS
jgi:hypothetical protein